MAKKICSLFDVINMKCVGSQILYTCLLLCSKILYNNAVLNLYHFLYICVGVDYGLPILHSSVHYACPNDVVTYTCQETQVYEINWIVEPHIPRMHPIRYTYNQHLLLINRTDHFFASLTNVTNINMEGRVADMTTSLTVVTDGLENGTIITCLTVTGDLKVSSSSSSLYIAGLVSYPLANHQCM